MTYQASQADPRRQYGPRCLTCGTPLYLSISVRLGYCDDHRPDPEPAPLLDALTPTCNSCDAITADLDAAGYCPACRPSGGAEGWPDGHPNADELPEGATVEPWTDADTDELGELMLNAAHGRRDRWMAFRSAADVNRWHQVARSRLTPDELATAAARFGIVADRHALPFNSVRRYTLLGEVVSRQRETGDLWAIVMRHYRNRDAAELMRTGPNREWAADILRGDALPFPESRQRADHDFMETHPSRYASWPIVQAAR